MKFTNNHGLPLPIYKALTEDEYDMGEGDYSTTGLINPPRITQLKMRHDDEIVTDAIDYLWAMHGTAMHHVLERANVEGAIREQMLYIELDGVKIKCQPDYIYPIEVGMCLMDLKNTSIYAIMDGPKEEWIKQLNIYHLACKKNDIPVTQLQIVAILKDWSYTECHVKKKENYPDAPIQVIDIPIWDISTTEDYVRSRLVLHENAKTLTDSDLPLCTDEERWVKNTGWACEYVSGASKGKAVKGASCLSSAQSAQLFQQERRKKARLANGGFKKGFIDTNVVFRPGEATRCERYCAASKFCNQFKAQGKVNPF